MITRTGLSVALRISLMQMRMNRFQTVLAVIGVMVGALAVVLSSAVIRGGQGMIEDELTAAGINMIVIRAGNYQLESPGSVGEATGHHADISFRSDAPDSLGEIAGQGWQLRQAVLRTNEGQGAQFRLIHEGAEAEDDIHMPGAMERPEDRIAGSGAAQTLVAADAVALATQIDSVRDVAAMVQAGRQVSLGDGAVRRFAPLVGIDGGFLAVYRSLEVVSGRALRATEVASGAPVVLLGSKLAGQLFALSEDPIGRTVRIGDRALMVVGIVDSASTPLVPTLTGDPVMAVYAPLPLVQDELGIAHVQSLALTTQSVGETAPTVRQIKDVLRHLHGLADAEPDDFTVRPQALALLAKGLAPSEVQSLAANLEAVDALLSSSLNDAIEANERNLTTLLSASAGLFILLGCAGIFVRMSLAVRQRRREVGLRMSQGAQRGDIALQFLVEGICLGTAGGVLGVIVALLAAAGMGLAVGSSFTPTLGAIALALLVSLIFPGLASLPAARRASRLSPMEALRRD